MHHLSVSQLSRPHTATSAHLQRRIRRVKCDEAKPACQRCVGSKRQCDGYLPQDSTVTRRQLAEAVRELAVVGPVSRALAQYPQHHGGGGSAMPSNLTLFDVFRKLTAPSTAAFMPSQFWTGELLQLAHSEPAVWHATLALGALHQKHEFTSRGEFHDQKVAVYSRMANQNYAQAVTYARELKNPHKLLSLSLALLSITNMMGRWGESRVHIMAGHKLLDQTKGHPATKIAAEMLTRLDLQAMTLSESSAPYPYQEAPQLADVVDCMRKTPFLEDYSQAGTALFMLMRRFLLEDEALAFDTAEVVADKLSMHSLMRDIVDWELKMARFERDRWTGEPAAISIRLYHAVLRAMVTATRVGAEVRWDELLGYFERVVALAEALRLATASPVPRSPMSLEPGLIIPLFIVVSKCRHPALRSRAVSLLLNLKRQEGTWFSDGAAAVGVKMMETEGQVFLETNSNAHAASYQPSSVPGQDIPWEAWSAGMARLPTSLNWAGIERVPEAQRVRETLVMVEIEQRRIDLTFIMCSGDDLGSYGEMRSECVRY
jgi:cholestenol delta-isomerase